MDYERLKHKKALFNQQKAVSPEKLTVQMEREFEEQFTYDSLALSGSALTREEVKTILAAGRQKENTEKETE